MTKDHARVKVLGYGSWLFALVSVFYLLILHDHVGFWGLGVLSGVFMVGELILSKLNELGSDD